MCWAARSLLPAGLHVPASELYRNSCRDRSAIYSLPDNLPQVLVFGIGAPHGPGPHALSLLPADASALTLSSSRKSAGEAYERRHQPVPAPAPASRFAPEKSGFAEAIQS